MLPDFEVMYRQTRSFESVPRRGMVTGPRRSGDVPVVDHPPPGSTRSVVTRVLQRLRPCSKRRTDRSGKQSQRREASATTTTIVGLPARYDFCSHSPLALTASPLLDHPIHTSTWSSLLCSCHTLPSFHRELKTELFDRACH